MASTSTGSHCLGLLRQRCQIVGHPEAVWPAQTEEPRQRLALVAGRGHAWQMHTQSSA